MLLNVLREKINKLDKDIIEKISERLKVARDIGRIKKQNGLPVEDLGREAELREWHKKISEEMGIEYAVVEKIFEIIMESARKVQK